MLFYCLGNKVPVCAEELWIALYSMVAILIVHRCDEFYGKDVCVKVVLCQHKQIIDCVDQIVISPSIH